MNIDLVTNKLGALVVGLSDAVEQITSGSSSTSAALLTLFHWQPIRTTDLAKVIGLSQPATTRLVASLREAGFVTDSTPEGRERPLMLTKDGIKHASELQTQRLAVLDQALSPLAKPDREAFDRMLSTILAGLVQDKNQARKICRNCDHGKCTGKLCPVGESARAITANAQHHAAGA